MVLGDAYEQILARKAIETTPKPDWRAYVRPWGVFVIVYALWKAQKGNR